MAEAPEPPVYDTEGLTYIDGVLIANKSYSLPATFAPGLESICYTQFQALSGAAAKEGLSIWLGSGYRPYHDQEIIYDNYVKEDGKDAADTYSARPGFSEHQTGLVIDCNTIDDMPTSMASLSATHRARRSTRAISMSRGISDMWARSWLQSSTRAVSALRNI